MRGLLSLLFGFFTVGFGLFIIYAICYVFSALIFWGIGSFIVWAFGIDFIWTFWHGLAVAIIFAILRRLFKKED